MVPGLDNNGGMIENTSFFTEHTKVIDLIPNILENASFDKEPLIKEVTKFSVRTTSLISKMQAKLNDLAITIS